MVGFKVFMVKKCAASKCLEATFGAQLDMTQNMPSKDFAKNVGFLSMINSRKKANMVLPSRNEKKTKNML